MTGEPAARSHDQISLVDLEKNAVPNRAAFEIPPRRVVGLKIFKWLLWLVVGMIALLVLYGWATYPRIDEIRSLAGAGSDATAAYTKARADWVASVKDLGQLFLITPILPLLSAVLGYMFGRNETVGEDPED